MTLTQKHLVSATIALVITIILALSYFSGQRVVASAPSGLAATIATTSPAAVSTTASLVFATSSCAARTITTVASPIMISFSDVQGIVPSGILGHQQAASTTVTYDSGQVGCGALRIYSFVASTITVSETR